MLSSRTSAGAKPVTPREDDERADRVRRFVTIMAKFPGNCRRCGSPFGAGQTIRWGGRGRTYHLSAVCPATLAMEDAHERAKVEPEAQSPAHEESSGRWVALGELFGVGS